MFGHFSAGRLCGLAPTGGYWWVGLISMAIKLILLVVIIVFAYRIIKSMAESYYHTRNMTDNKALAILRERYARGEIDTEEFNMRKSGLE